MKKIIALLLAAVMLTLTVSLVSCGNKNSGESTNGTTTEGTTPSGTTTAGTTTEATTTTAEPEPPVTPAYASALELYEKIWASYTDDDKFASAGGDMDHMSSDGGPGIVDIEKSKDTIKSWTRVTDELLDTVTNDAANLIHMMNTNTFSSAIFHLKDASAAETFASDYNKAIQGTRWMCGFPDKVIVISVGEYVLVAFGNNELVDTLKTKCLAADSSAVVLIDTPVVA